MKAVDYTVNSPYLVLGSELIADFRVKTKASTPCSSPGPGLRTATQDSAENGAKNKKHPVSSSSVCKNSLLMREVRGEGPD